MAKVPAIVDENCFSTCCKSSQSSNDSNRPEVVMQRIVSSNALRFIPRARKASRGAIMRKYPIAMATLIALACSGCGSSKDWEGDYHVLTNYGNVPPQKFQFQGTTWGILDKPDDRFPDSPVLTGQMIVVSLGAYWPGPERWKQTEAAAHGYLERSKGDCTILSSMLASSTDYSLEFYYSCKK